MADQSKHRSKRFCKIANDKKVCRPLCPIHGPSVLTGCFVDDIVTESARSIRWQGAALPDIRNPTSVKNTQTIVDKKGRVASILTIFQKCSSPLAVTSVRCGAWRQSPLFGLVMIKRLRLPKRMNTNSSSHCPLQPVCVLSSFIVRQLWLLWTPLFTAVVHYLCICVSSRVLVGK